MSIAPPGWAEPAVPVAPVAPAGRPAPDADDLRGESRRALDSRRVGARVVDWLICLPLTGLVIWLWGWHLGTLAIYHCLLLILHHVCEVTTGATPGKRLFGLRVARLADGGLPLPRQAAIRGVVGIFEFGLVAPIVVVLNKGRRRVGDFLAGTAVVDARRHPVAPRPLLRGALVYPAVWAVPALVACVLGARGELPLTYRQTADNVCAAQELIGSALMPDGSPLPVTEDAAIEIEQAFVGRIAALAPPRMWRARHDDLVARLQARAARHVAARADARLRARADTSAFVAQEQALRAADDAALAAEGFRACAHRAGGGTWGDLRPL